MSTSVPEVNHYRTDFGLVGGPGSCFVAFFWQNRRVDGVHSAKRSSAVASAPTSTSSV